MLQRYPQDGGDSSLCQAEVSGRPTGPRAPLPQILALPQTLNGLLLALVLIVMLILINDQEVMGHHVNAVSFNSVAWASPAVMIALSLLLLITGFG
ncbi:MAG: hypothetical protein ACHQ7N_10055 [Candidatus Methylomirabilales bacterium]